MVSSRFREAKTGTHKLRLYQDAHNVDAASLLTRCRRLWVPVFACRETGMTLEGGAGGRTELAPYSAASVALPAPGHGSTVTRRMCRRWPG